MIALKNVLVATDFGEASKAALAYGGEFARTFDPDAGAVGATTVLRVSSNPAAAIVAFATEAAIDCIVIGTHGRGALAHLFVGSVAERVVRTAPCPVLTVRHPEREFIVPDPVAR